MWSLKFRRWLGLWEESQTHAKKVNGIIEINGLIFFFTKDGEVYGATEEGRLIFAKMKDPHDKDIEGDEASFMAYNLKQALAGKEVAKNFRTKDLKGLKVVDQKRTTELLSNKSTK